jgi:hypothetical protein
MRTFSSASLRSVLEPASLQTQSTMPPRSSSSSRRVPTVEVRRERFNAAVALCDAPLDVRHHRLPAFGQLWCSNSPRRPPNRRFAISWITRESHPGDLSLVVTPPFSSPFGQTVYGEAPKVAATSRRLFMARIITCVSDMTVAHSRSGRTSRRPQMRWNANHDRAGRGPEASWGHADRACGAAPPAIVIRGEVRGSGAPPRCRGISHDRTGAWRRPIQAAADR